MHFTCFFYERKLMLVSSVLFLSAICVVRSDPPAKDVFDALRHVCTGKFEGGSCPYATQLAGDWHNKDGSVGLWSDGGFRLWWPSGVGLWSYAEFLHTMEGRSKNIDFIGNWRVFLEICRYG
mgnify:FL=1